MQMFIGGMLLWCFLGFACLYPIPQNRILRKIRIFQIYFYVAAPVASAAMYYLGISVASDFLAGSALRNAYAVLIVSAIFAPIVNVIVGSLVPGIKEDIDKIIAKAFAYPIGIMIGLFAFGVEINPENSSPIANSAPNFFIKYAISPLADFMADLCSRYIG